MRGSGHDFHNLHVDHINITKLYRQDGPEDQLPQDGRHLPDLLLQHCDRDNGCPHLHGHDHSPWRGDGDHCQHQPALQYVLVTIHHCHCHHPAVGVTKVQPLAQHPAQEESQSGSSSRVSSAKSIVSSMFSGSEEEEVEYDAYAKARKINLYGQVRPGWPLVTGSPT